MDTWPWWIWAALGYEAAHTLTTFLLLGLAVTLGRQATARHTQLAARILVEHRKRVSLVHQFETFKEVQAEILTTVQEIRRDLRTQEQIRQEGLGRQTNINRVQAERDAHVGDN